MSAVLVKRYDAPRVDHGEILRYAGVRGEAPELMPLLEECLGEMLPLLSYRVAYAELPLAEEHGYGFRDRLRGCERVVVFGATVGLAPDRLVARYGSTAPTKALLCQAIGAERIEALCDAFCEELSREKQGKGAVTRPRFSPGYGDCSLSLQAEIIQLLDAPRKIGLTLNESLLLTPTKSVTAIVGIENKNALSSEGTH